MSTTREAKLADASKALGPELIRTLALIADRITRGRAALATKHLRIELKKDRELLDRLLAQGLIRDEYQSYWPTALGLALSGQGSTLLSDMNTVALALQKEYPSLADNAIPYGKLRTLVRDTHGDPAIPSYLFAKTRFCTGVASRAI